MQETQFNDTLVKIVIVLCLPTSGDSHKNPVDHNIGTQLLPLAISTFVKDNPRMGTKQRIALSTP